MCLQFESIEQPIPGWRLDKVRRIPVHGEVNYSVDLIRLIDGATVYGINKSLADAFYEVKAVAEKLDELDDRR